MQVKDKNKTIQMGKIKVFFYIENYKQNKFESL